MDWALCILKQLCSYYHTGPCRFLYRCMRFRIGLSCRVLYPCCLRLTHFLLHQEIQIQGCINWPVCCRDFFFLTKFKSVACNGMFLFISVLLCNFKNSTLSSFWEHFWLICSSASFVYFPRYVGEMCVFRYTPQGYCSKPFHQELHVILIIALVHWPPSMCSAADFTLVSYSHKSNAFLMWTYFPVNNLAHGQLQGDPESVWWVERARGGICSSSSLTRQKILD